MIVVCKVCLLGITLCSWKESCECSSKPALASVHHMHMKKETSISLSRCH